MNVFVEYLPSGETNLIIEKDGKKNPVYSRHSPGRDGLRFFKGNYEAGCDLYVLIGLGLGYHIEPFVQEQSVEKVVVLEPFEEVYTAVRSFEMVKRILTHPKVEVIWGQEVEKFIKEMKGRYDFLFHKKIRVFSYPPLRRLFQPLYGGVEKRLREALNTLIDDSLTIAHFARTWLRNFSANINKGEWVRPLASITGSCRGTAVVTGAGPSLDRWVGGLKKKRSAFFLIAPDASVKPLIQCGITPDLLISIDPQPLVWSHFSGIQDSVLKSIPVVLSPLSNPRLFDTFKNRYIYFTSHPTTRLFPPDVVRSNLITQVGSVGTLALRIALMMGFEHILLAGFDFSYPGMKAYAKGSFFYEYCIGCSSRTAPQQTHEAALLRRSTGMAEVAAGQFLLSSENLLRYRREMEELVGHRGSARIQQLSGGLTIRGAVQVTEIPEMGGFNRKRDASMRISLSEGVALDMRTIQMLTVSLALRYRMLKHLDNTEAYERSKEYLRKMYNLRQ